MPFYHPELPLLPLDAPAIWVRIVPQVWDNDSAEDSPIPAMDFAWDAAFYVAALSPENASRFMAGLGEDRAINYQAFDYDSLPFEDPYAPPSFRDWLSESEVTPERTFRLEIFSMPQPDAEVLAWRENVMSALAISRKGALEKNAPSKRQSRPRA